MDEIIDIYIIKVNDNLDYKKYLHLCSEETVKGLKIQKRKNSIRQIVLSDTIKKFIIHKNTGRSVDEITIQRNKFGKPFLENHHFKFNISHTASYFAIISSNVFEVGIDIEYINRSFDIDNSMLNSVFSPNEINLIKQNHDTFYSFWTKKESYVKTLGVGFLRDDYIKTNFSLEASQLYNNCAIYTPPPVDDHALSLCLLRNSPEVDYPELSDLRFIKMDYECFVNTSTYCK